MLRLGTVNFPDELTSVLPLDRTGELFSSRIIAYLQPPGSGLKFSTLRSILKVLIVLQMPQDVLVNALIDISKF